MGTKQRERIRRLIEMLKKTDRIHLKDATRTSGVFVMTIRHNLHQEDEPLPLALLGGYIVMAHKPAPSMPVIQDVPRNHHDDLPIAILAAGMVNENDLIFFDNSQEIPLAISMVPDTVAFTGICYSHRVFAMLNERPNVTVVLCGGTCRARNDAFCDVSNSSPSGSFDPRKIFTSASDVHDYFGVSWFNPEDLATKRKVMARGLRKTLFARHASFDEVASASLAPLSALDVLINGRPLPADCVTHYRNTSVKVITPDSEDERSTERTPYLR